MAIAETKRAAERHLSTLTPALPTAYEGVNFTPPAGMYQRTQLSIRSPDDPVLGKGYYRERLQFQVFIVGKKNEGTGDAIARAELVRNHFGKGLFLSEAGVDIHVLATPQISGTAVAEDRVIIPVLIDLVAEVFTN